ncbi:HAD family hydrolase [Pseudonocardia sp. CNS-139]|nr:HAD family hydrolase [Pseudonocardia sp. CNS-139]
MQAPRLVATDVDGTLLAPDDRVSQRAAAVIGRLAAAEVGFVLVTGRPPRWIPPVAEQVGGVGLVVCANGGVLYDAAADRVVWSCSLGPSALDELAGLVDDALPGSRLAVERVPAGAADPLPFVAEEGYRHAWAPGVGAVADRAEVLAAPAVKLLVRNPDMTSDEMAAVLGPVVGAAADLTYSTRKGLLELSPPGVTKATGLAGVAERHGVAAADVVAFGDMPNDLEMLVWAGHGVAMGNAHPALLAVADEVTASNADDGLALVLERWF